MERELLARAKKASRAVRRSMAEALLIAYATGVVVLWAVAARLSRLSRPGQHLRSRLPRTPSLTVRALRVVTMTVAMTFVFATVLGASGLVAQRGTVAFGSTTTLTIVRGEVAVQLPDAPAFRAAIDGDLLVAGTTVRTGDDAYAVITYFEGSTVSLDPATTLVITALSLSPGGSTSIEMDQPAGRTWHAVRRLLSGDSKYELHTPSATAAVRGTAFTVQVTTTPSGESVTVVQTAEGAVATRKAAEPGQPEPAEEVVVREGFRTTVQQGAPLREPEPAPEPERTVTVSLGATAGIVLDSVGRANGIRDGVVVLQTPGAAVRVEDGQLIVTLPDVADGRVAALVQPSVRVGPVDVVTEVADRGVPLERVQERVIAGRAVVAAAVELRRGGSATRLDLAEISREDVRDLAAGLRVADPERGAPGGPPGFFPAATVPPIPIVDHSAPAQAERPEASEESAPVGVSGFVPLGKLPALPGLGQRAAPERPLPPQARDETPPPASPRPQPAPPNEPRATSERTAPPSATPEPARSAPQPPGSPTEAPVPVNAPTPPPAAPSADARGFVPAASLRPLPFGSGSPPGAPSATPRSRP